MKYKIVLNGYGKFLSVGKITKEQYDFWSNFTDREATCWHLFEDPSEAINNNPVYDCEDPRFLGIAKSINSVVQVYSPFKDYVHLHVLDENNNHVYITDTVTLDGSFNIDTENLRPPAYYLKAWHDRKGNFFTGEIETDDVFDVNKLKFNQCTIDNETFIYRIEYNRRMLKSNEDLTSIKGWDYKFINTNGENNDNI